MSYVLTGLLMLANFLYLWTHGWGPIYFHPHLLIYNITIFLVIGSSVFLAFNYYLYRWFVKR